jgi:hypothetical protein
LIISLWACAEASSTGAEDESSLSPTNSIEILATINAPALAAPEEQRAWPLYREALLMLRSDDSLDLTKDLSRTAQPTDESWSDIVAALERNAEAIALLRRAAARKRLGFVVGFGLVDEADWELVGWDAEDQAEAGADWLLEMPLVHLSPMRRSAAVLRADLLAAVEAGDTARAIADFEAMVGLARHAREPAFAIAQWVGTANLEVALGALQQVLLESPPRFSEEELRRLADLLAEVSASDVLTNDTSIEKLMFEDAIAHTFADSGENKGRVTAEGLERWDRLAGHIIGFLEGDSEKDQLLGEASRDFWRDNVATADAQLAMYQRLLDGYHAWAELPLWQREECSAERIAGELSSETVIGTQVAGIRYLPVVVINPAATMVRADLQMKWTEQHLDVVRTLVALELCHRQSGEYPEDLDTLAPSYLDELRLDHFDGAPIKYRKGDAGFVLYSVGTDRDDDGGRAPEHGDVSRWIPREALERRDVPDGDWVLVDTRR